MNTLLKKKDLIDRLAAKGYTKKGSSEILDDVFDMIKEAMLDGNDIVIHGFGTFVIKEVSQRDTIDVTTGQRITLPAYKTPKFVAGDALKNSIKLHCRADN